MSSSSPPCPVTTVDSTHHEFIVKGLQRGLTVITEKPMTTDEIRCQAIIDAEKKSSGRLLVGLNYRYGDIFSRLKEDTRTRRCAPNKRRSGFPPAGPAEINL